MTTCSQSRIAAAYQSVFHGQDGQLVLADLARRFGFTHRSTFPDNGDPNRMIFNEGGRAALIHIGRMIEADLDELKAQEDAIHD
ncbi:hypothetical protein [uncultured Rhodospira sp.]|uniref:Bbp19 family protein n=1 Tax=uncultured Rhodospira sp. TaxID=1936189 RepID=UPI00262C25D3|nr:hypothetical protein [uncultured Rhodospira sp.]